MNDLKINKIKNRINTDCCTHYNGVNSYQIGYIGLKCFLVAICDNCNETQDISSPIASFILRLFIGFWNGKITLLNLTVSK